MAAESYARGATEPALIEQTIGDFFDAMVARQPDALALVSRHEGQRFSYRELQAFTQSGSDLDKATQDQLTRGSPMTELLKQGRYNPMPVAEQVIAIFAGNQGFLDDLPLDAVVRFRTEMLASIRASKPEIIETINTEKKLTDATETALKEAIAAFKARAKLVGDTLGKSWRIKQLSVGSSGGRPPVYPRMKSALMAAEAVPMPLEGGDSAVTVNISGQIELAD